MKQRSRVQPGCTQTPLLATVLLLSVSLSCAARVAIGAEDDRPPGPAGDRWAVLVGVNKYKHIRPELSYCAADVRALGELLIKAGFSEDRVVIVHDQATDPGLLPTKANIEKQVALTLDSVGPDDFVLLAFSGHGVRLEQQSYLCPFDAKMDPADLIAVNSVYQRLQACPARFKLFLVDACQDDRSQPKELVATRAAGEISPLAFGPNEAMPPGLLLLTSCSPGQKSVEEPQFGHGVFTHFLLEGLEGEADSDKSGTVSLLEWTGYASSKTRAYVRSLDRVQNPSMRGDFPDFELVQNVRLVRAKEAMKKGEELWKNHKVAEALEQFRLATELAPENAEAHRKSGDAHGRMCDDDAALAAYDRAITIDPQCASAYLGRAGIRRRHSADEEASADLEIALQITTRLLTKDPTNGGLFIERASAYNQRGLIRKEKADWEKAVADATEALRLDSQDVQAFHARAIPRNNLERFQEAIADCTSAIAIDPKYGDLYRVRAYAYGTLGSRHRNAADLERALSDDNEALRLDPKNVEAYRNRAIDLNNLSRFDEAIADCDKAITFAPEFADLYRVRAYAYVERGLVRQEESDLAKAIADATETLRLDSDNAEAYYTRGRAFSYSGRFDEAIADCSKAIALSTENEYAFCERAWAYKQRGSARLAKGDWEKAVSDATEALRLNRRNLDAYLVRAQAFTDLKRFDEAVADCTEAIAIDPTIGWPYSQRAYAHHGKGEYDRAIADCDEALKRDPSDAAAKSTRAAASRAKKAK